MSSPDITDAERNAVKDVLKGQQLSMGPKIKAFEDAFRSFTGCRHAIAVNSGTSALHLCVRAAGITSGDLIITTPFSFISSTNVILFEQATPIFVDVDPETGNIDPDKVKSAVADITQNSTAAKKWFPRKGTDNPGSLKAILAVDVFGQPADFDPLCSIAEDANLKLIEDSCEALGAEYKGRKAGTLGDYGTFAFYPNKQITTGEGGMIVTDDTAAANFMSALRNQGRDPGDTWLQHTHLGYNYRLGEISAAIGVVQMERLEELLQSRDRVAQWYMQYLSDIDEVKPPYIDANTTRVSWFVFVIRVCESLDRDVLAQSLKEHDIPVRPYFLPIHLQPYMIDKFGYKPGDFPVTEELGRKGLALPFSGLMTEKEVKKVCEAIKSSLAQINKI